MVHRPWLAKNQHPATSALPQKDSQIFLLRGKERGVKTFSCFAATSRHQRFAFRQFLNRVGFSTATFHLDFHLIRQERAKPGKHNSHMDNEQIIIDVWYIVINTSMEQRNLLHQECKTRCENIKLGCCNLKHKRSVYVRNLKLKIGILKSLSLFGSRHIFKQLSLYIKLASTIQVSLYRFVTKTQLRVTAQKAHKVNKTLSSNLKTLKTNISFIENYF